MTTSYRGSRKHVLDWTGRPGFLSELAALLTPAPIRLSNSCVFMPKGVGAPAEARLEAFGPACFPEQLAIWAALQDWWLTHKAGANTPNWDIAVACEIHGQPGLVLVEAKANWPELGVAGKSLSIDASGKSRENHERIGGAIADACTGWRTIDQRIDITRDSHYQLANRLAFTWKLATLGIPTILVYLGFTGDEGIRDAGQPFADDADWRKAFEAYASNAIPLELFDRCLTIASTPVWLMVRSRSVLEISPPP